MPPWPHGAGCTGESALPGKPAVLGSYHLIFGRNFAGPGTFFPERIGVPPKAL